jgi:hypothetical protein
MRSRAEEIDFDLYAQEELYKKETGDRHWYVGFGRRFGEWCAKNPRRELAQKKEAPRG